MLIKKLKAKNFRNLRSVDLDFTPGINLVKAPNEGGKSSLRQTICLAIYADPKSTSSKIQNLQTWGNDVMYEVSMYFATEKGEYRLTKDFEAKTSVLEELNTGKKIATKQKIAEAITEITGLPTEVLFKNTVFFSAEELTQVKNTADLRIRLEEKLCGIEGVSAADIIKGIDAKLSELNKGINKPAKNPGPVKLVLDKIEVLKQGLDQVKNEVETTAKTIEKITDLNQQFSKLGSDLELKKSEYDKCRIWKTAKENYDHFNKKFRETMELAQKRKELESASNDLAGQVQAIQGAIEKIEPAIPAMDNLFQLSGKVINAERQLEQSKAIVGRIEEAEMALALFRQRLSECTQVEPLDLKNCSSMAKTIDVLQRAGKEQGFIVDLTPLAEIKPEIVVDKINVSLVNGESLDARSEVLINIPGIASIKIAGKNPEAHKNLEKERSLATELVEKLNKYQVNTVSELEDLHNRWSLANAEVEKKTITLEAYLGGRVADEYKKSLQGQEAALAIDRDKLFKEYPNVQRLIKDLSPEISFPAEPEDCLELLRRKKQEFDQAKIRLQSQMNGLNNKYQQALGALQNLPPAEQIIKDKENLALETIKAQTVLESFSLPDMSLEKVVAIEAAIGQMERQLNNLELERRHLNGALNQAKYGIDDLASLEEEYDYYQLELESYRKEYRLLQSVRNLLLEARGQTISKIAGEIGTKAQDYLNRLTGGRYAKIDMDSGELEMKVFSQAKGDYVDINEELSTGTRDQAYLALRLALVPAIAKGRKPPILIDDSLAFFDEGRRQNAFAILREISQEHQVIIFSCHDYYDELADNIIKLN